MDMIPEMTSMEPKKPKNKWGLMTATVLLSALVGSGTTIALVPTLMKSNLVSSITSSSGVANATTLPTTNTSVNVNSGIVSAVNKAKSSVVGVVNLQKTNSFQGYGSDLQGDSSQQAQPAGTGSGVLFDPNGYIVTNNHVVEGADKVQISLQDGKYYDAKVVGTDPMTDLAVIKVDPSVVKNLTPAQFGDSDSLQVGEQAIAIGNPLGQELSQTVTVGVISALNRDMPVTDEQTGQPLGDEKVLQTDASINPGNSGGALLNIAGQVIGINSAKIASSGVEGIGFAIPINEAKPIINQLIQNGQVTRPVIGIAGEPLEQVTPELRPNVPTSTGFLVESLNNNASQEGIQKLDVIVKIENQSVQTASDLSQVLSTKKPGDKVSIQLYRGSQLVTVQATLSKSSSGQQNSGSQSTP